MNTHWLAEQLLKYPNTAVYIALKEDLSDKEIAFSIDLMDNGICITGLLSSE